MKNINDYKNFKQKVRIGCGILNKKAYTGPWTVQIDLTNECNNDCIACWCHSPLLGKYAMNKETRSKFIPYERAIKLIDELDKLGTRDIYFTGGGEPFMHPKIIDIMKHVKSKGMRLDMSTNFTLVTKRIAKELVELGMDHINLSLWASSPKVYSDQHPNKNEKTFEKMIEIIHYINKLKKEKGTQIPRIGIYNVMTTHNYHEFEEMVEFAYKHKVDDIDFTPVDTVKLTHSIRLKKDQMKFITNKMEKLNFEILEKKYNHKLVFMNFDTFLRRMKNTDSKEANYDTDVLDQLPSCYAGWTFARVMANGDVNSCLKSFKIPIGNIFKDSFKDIWFGKKQETFRKHTIDYDKKNPYFKNIGSDHTQKEQGCYKCCDNLGFNLYVHGSLQKFSPNKKRLLKLARYMP